MLLAAALSLSSLVTPQNPFVDSETVDDFLLARSLAATGDVNGDGWPEVLVADRLVDEGRGRAYLFDGESGRSS